ncbi:MAG: class D sortase [Oscillospiraceae bacterium]|nr:class D sortase [Oscillospiraceae bacterium]
MNEDKKNESKKSGRLLISVLTPIFILIICLGITIVAVIKPYNKISTYLNLAFMDSLKTIPDTNGITAGLNIKENEIKVEYDKEFSETGKVIRPSFGEQFAIISSDKFELDVPVYWGSNSELFERGACQSSSSMLIGEIGNAVISAHVNTFFSELEKLESGDKVEVATNYGIFTYEVTETVEFKKSNKKYIIPKDEEVLTLYTCKPDVLGASDLRIGAVCKVVDKKFYINSEDGQKGEQ